MSRTDQRKAMHEYLDALLFEQPAAEQEPAVKTPAVKTVESKEIERLLVQAAVQPRPVVQVNQAADDLEQEARLAAEMEAMREPPAQSQPDAMENYRSSEFQALFFSVAGLKLAVPLKSLGGIHNWIEPNSIFGKPAWYMGIMASRDVQLNVVDTARWVMPEKYDSLASALKYQYMITLGSSNWGLACEQLVTTESLAPDDVQWRKESGGKRPWLAGVVREKMCAILDVDAMVAMLDQGLSSRDS